jgi:MSHA biogenesis protein MshJ
MIGQFTARLRQLGERIDALTLRERALVFLATLGVLYIVAAHLLLPPLKQAQDRLERELQAKRAETAALEGQIHTLLTGEPADADPVKRARYAELKVQHRALDETLGRVTHGLVPPQEMVRLIERMFAQRQGLKFERAQNLPPTPLVESGAGADGAVVYRHAMRLEMSGSYLEILAYLQQLERLPWKVFWGQLSLQVEKPPVSEVSVVVHTLSSREGWIGL